MKLRESMGSERSRSREEQTYKRFDNVKYYVVFVDSENHSIEFGASSTKKGMNAKNAS